jgi:23S rRNA pseudouridine2605 synthase
MKKDSKSSINEPFYSKYKKPEIVKTSAKADKLSDKKRPRTRIDKSADKPFDFEKRNFDKPYERRNDRPERSGNDKPAFKKSFDKPYESRGGDKPAFKKSFDKPFERRDDRNERPAFNKPYGEKRSFDKPYESRGGDKPTFKKSFDKPFDRRDDRSERPAFNKPYGEKRSFDKPYESRGERPERRDDKPAFKKSFDKPFERREERSERPERGERSAFNKPYGEKRSFDKPYESRDERPERREDKPAFKKSFDKPFERRDERSERPERGERPAFNKPYGEKRSFDKPFEKRGRQNEPSDDKEKRSRAEDAERRRVGDFTEAPRYDFRQAEERFARKGKHEAKTSGDNRIRLNKYIANAGLCSRREADELIEAGQITVNGQVVNELGYRVNPGEVVKYGNRVLNPEKMVYILVNKPKDYITTTDDPEGRHTVMELIAGACQERVYPVGRLDRNTTGLLLLTNDGELAEKLMHPSNQVHKIYQVEIDKPITTADFEKIKEGLELEDGFIKPDDLALVTPDAMVVGIEIHSGRNRIVRRIFESLGYEVLKLDRTVYGGLTKKELPRGKWRFLNEKEVVKMKYLM